MRQLLLATLVALSASNCSGQSVKNDTPNIYSNMVGVSIGAMYFPKLGYHGEGADQVGFTYERKIYRNIFLSTGIYLWNSNGGYPNYYVDKRFIVPENKGTQPGALTERINYNTIELVPEYRLHSRNYKNTLCLGTGMSYTFGENEYIKSVFIHPAGYGEQETDYEYGTQQGSYYGVVGKAAYTHFFFHNRLGLGAEGRYRYYFGLNEREYDVDATLKFCF